MAMTSPESRLVLGTAQFGSAYGIANAVGQVSASEGRRMLELAQRSGACMLDTAIAYGNSERTLGAIGVSDWQVVTKLPVMPDAWQAHTWVRDQVSGSLARLGIGQLHGLLLHRPAQLLAPEGRRLYEALLEEREGGRVRNIGISIYGPDELDRLPASMEFDIVQAPLNAIDGRLLRSGWVARLQDAGCEVHLRSVFLQGLLLMDPAGRPAYFDRWRGTWQLWDDWLKRSGLSALEACLRYALHAVEGARIVVGADSASQLEEIIAAMKGPLPPLPAGLAVEDLALLNPALWTRA